MLKEVIVVEGKQDIVAVQKAVEADCIATGGYSLLRHTVEHIRQAYEQRGIIIFTDPDSAGERIRRYLAKRFPAAQHAYISRKAATARGDIGVEQAEKEAIRAALAKLQCTQFTPSTEFVYTDLVVSGLAGGTGAAERRQKVGDLLGIGYGNAKTFLVRLNHYGVSRDAYDQAVAEMEEKA